MKASEGSFPPPGTSCDFANVVDGGENGGTSSASSTGASATQTGSQSKGTGAATGLKGMNVRGAVGLVGILSFIGSVL